MSGYDAQAAAHVIAGNVVSAYARERPGLDTIGATVRDIAMAELMRTLLRVLPTDDGMLLATVCNFALEDALGAMDPGGPRVESVDPDTGVPTMRLP
ncbi:hypothetical protein SAMN05216360_12756 [Methylobacterium phyllostachyos]|uniref:Uncharacterized protein n=1 Tax=Methylobacterium phyllostachyos TaxID=582672 RepID=A0A1H0KKT7_9HYPH|nr:hypothetical protein [Methylobacterium phyllostachyos]SDO56604.1 hypothetical protein SAMN05216360_12756 [Methylobacterium phyllostachyos]